MKPKFLLTAPLGNLMLGESISGLDLSKFDLIIIAILDEHERKYQAADAISRQAINFGVHNKLHIFRLTQPTNSEPETVARVISDMNINGSIVIKDSDNYFKANMSPGNFVVTADLNKIDTINPSNKSYVSVNDDSTINTIVEKNVISNQFCCGAYGFLDAKEYLSTYRQLENLNNLYLSHVIYKRLLGGIPFESRVCSDYEDFGTLEDWNRYKGKFGTVFIDLDGVLVDNSSEYTKPLWGKTWGIQPNIAEINRLYDSGRVKIVLTTSRKDQANKLTENQLWNIGLRYHYIVFGLPHGKRVLINDFAPSNPYPAAIAINIERDSDKLKEQISNIFKG